MRSDNENNANSAKFNFRSRRNDNSLRIETQWKANANDAQNTIRNRLNVALASLRAQARASVASRSSGANQTNFATTTANPIGASPVSELVTAQFSDDDMRICTINTVKSDGWQNFYAGQIEALDVVR